MIVSCDTCDAIAAFTSTTTSTETITTRLTERPLMYAAVYASKRPERPSDVAAVAITARGIAMAAMTLRRRPQAAIAARHSQTATN